jgi:hypothetical protein
MSKQDGACTLAARNPKKKKKKKKTFLDEQHIPVWSCSSFLQVLFDNFPTTKTSS